MHGLGNDFVILDGIAQPLPSDLAELGQRVCHRRFGVGSDGLIALTLHKDGLEMRMWNPDGSNGGMCGNGLRCVARLAFDKGYVPDTFGVLIGERYTEVIIEDSLVQVNMGPYDLSPISLGTTAEIFGRTELGLESWGVSMGNPHWVFFGPPELDGSRWIAENGPKLELDPRFSNRTNVHLAQSVGPNHLKMVTWERGAGLTFACGSGACAVGVSGLLSGRTSNEVRVTLPGGELSIHVGETGVWMTGAAEYSFSGIWRNE